MKTYYFPALNKDYTYLQTNRSDDIGSLWSSMGLDFQSNLGTMRVAPRMLTATTTVGLGNLGLPVAFAYSQNALWAVAGSRVFVSSTAPNSGWAEDGSASAATDYDGKSDLAVFKGDLYASTTDELLSKSSLVGAWTSRDTLSIGSTAHPLCYFSVYNRLYYGYDSTTVKSIDTSAVVSSGSYQLDISSTSYGSILGMVATSTSIWISCIGNTSDGTEFGSILQWDGISAQITKPFPFKARYIQAMCVYKDVVYAMDGNGILSKFDGYTFSELGRLPFVSPIPTTTYVQRNGMIPTKNGTILVMVQNLNSGATSTYPENIPSGIWEWSEDFGFTHKFSPSYTPASSLSSISDFGQNIISAPGALFDVSTILPSGSGRNGTVLAGATYYTNASTTTNAIFVDDSTNTVQKKGYFVTTWFNADNIQDNWSRLWSTFRRFLTATDSIVFKYRITEEDPLLATITWVNTTSFTTTTNVSAYAPTATGFNGTQGGEVEILQGTGGASCAHITEVTNNAGTYTVTLDTAITGATTGTAIARFQKWIKLNPTSEPAQISSYLQSGIAASNIRIQVKGCLTFTGNGEFYKLILASNEDIKVTL